MTENRYDDDILSTIIDGEASPEIVAAVEADPSASQRLIDLRAAVDLVAAPVPEATPERRSASIAAAMAAATPASPEVTSLSAKRHEKTKAKKGISNSWLIAAAAAVILFVLAVPTFLGRQVDGTFEAINSELATGELESADDGADRSLANEAAAAPDVPDAVEAIESDEEAMEDEEEAIEDEEEAFDGVEEEAMEDVADAAEAQRAPTDLNLQVVPSLDELELRIGASAITPDLAGDDILAIETFQARTAGDADNLDEVLATDVNPDCLQPPAGVTNATPYALVVLDPFAGAAQLVIVEFNDDGTTRLLDAETCGVIG